jgi:putative transposase
LRQKRLAKIVHRTEGFHEPFQHVDLSWHGWFGSLLRIIDSQYVNASNTRYRGYHRHLPHWRQDQATYFVPWRLARGQPELDSGERDLVAAAIISFRARQYELAAYVVMDDHVHALVAPLPGYDLAGILHSWKSFTARQMQREHKRYGCVWQDEYFDRIVRDDKEFVQKLNYIVQNPWKRWPEMGKYDWVWPLVLLCQS